MRQDYTPDADIIPSFFTREKRLRLQEEQEEEATNSLTSRAFPRLFYLFFFLFYPAWLEGVARVHTHATIADIDAGKLP